MRVAAILTCHNRRETTLKSLRALAACELPTGWILTVLLVDDGSTDGTAKAVSEEFPDVTVISGDGSLFWSGGMRLGFSVAMSTGYDAYLWLNDDTVLFPAALSTLARCQDQLQTINGPTPCIIVGATCDAETGKLTYGGLMSKSWWSRHNYVRLPQSAEPQKCDSMNGNCVLIPAEIASTVGNIDPDFVHAMGDHEYGLRARKLGYGVWMAPEFVGTCSLNTMVPLKKEEATSIRAQLKRVNNSKRVPFKSWKTYVQRHYGMSWPLHVFRPHLSAIKSAILAKYHYRKSS